MASRIYGAAEELMVRFGFSSHEAPLLIINEKYQETLRDRLDPEILEKSRQEGRKMNLNEILRNGLGKFNLIY